MMALVFIIAGITLLAQVFVPLIVESVDADCSLDEAFEQWLFEMPLQEFFLVQTKVRLAVACLLFGGFLLARFT